MRLLHTGDLHLGAAFSSLPEALAARRRREQPELLARMGALARRERVEVTLIAGDLFDTPSPPEALARQTAGELARFPGRVFLTPGNHDYFTPEGPYARDLWPANVTVFRGPRLTRVALPELDAAVWGFAYTASAAPGPLEGTGALGRGEETTLLCLHSDVNRPQSPYAPVTGAQLAATGVHYAALGHVHTPAAGTFGGTPWAYCGTPEARGFDEAEGETPPGVLLGEVRGTRRDLRRVVLAARRVREVRVPLTASQDPLTALLAALPVETRQDLWRVTLTGEQRPAPDLEGLRRALSERFFYLELRDETRMPRDLWDALGEPTLRGRFLQALRDRGQDPALTELAARWGLAALTGDQEPEEGGPL